MAKQQIMEKPIWLKYTDDEVKAIIVKLANKGLSAEKIGLSLRDRYGIPKAKLFGIKIKKILENENKYTEPTVQNLQKKLDTIIAHNKKNKQDKKAERALVITKAKLQKREKYHAK